MRRAAKRLKAQPSGMRHIGPGPRIERICALSECSQAEYVQWKAELVRTENDKTTAKHCRLCSRWLKQRCAGIYGHDNTYKGIPPCALSTERECNHARHVVAVVHWWGMEQGGAASLKAEPLIIDIMARGTAPLIKRLTSNVYITCPTRSRSARAGLLRLRARRAADSPKPSAPRPRTPEKLKITPPNPKYTRQITDRCTPVLCALCACALRPFKL
jgi:hypothetical protein